MSGNGEDLINTLLTDDDLLAQVFRRVALGDVLAKADLDSCALVCRRWLAVERASRRAATVPVDGPAAEEVIRCVAELYPGLTEVCLDRSICITAGAAAAAAARSHGAEAHEIGSPRTAPMQEGHGNGVMPPSMTDEGLVHLVERGKRLEKLSLNGYLNASTIGLLGIASGCPNLKSIELAGVDVQDSDLVALAEGCNLNDLTLSAVQKLTDEGLVEFVKIRGKSLVSLDVSDCDGCITDGSSLHAIGFNCHNLEALSVYSIKQTQVDEGIISVAKGCRSLKSLKLSKLGVGDKAFEAVGSFCAALITLSLVCIGKCTDRSLLSIANGCRQLKSVLIFSCQFTDRSIKHVYRNCKMLQHLDICLCHSIQTAALEHIGQQCMNLLDLSLKNMRVENNSFLEFGRGCFLLSSINLTSCRRISDEAICHIAQGCKNLRKVSIIRCHQIGDEAITSIGENCKELTELTLHYLLKLTDTGIAAIQQCCFIQHLDINGCTKITDNGLAGIVKECHDLTHMDISNTMYIGDATLARLGDGCPKLNFLGMLECDMVTDDGLAHIARGCVRLEVCEVSWCTNVTPAGVATLIKSCSRLQIFLVEESKVSEEMAAKCRIVSPN